VVLSLDGEPKLMPFATPVAPNKTGRTSRDSPGLTDLEEGIDFARLEDLVRESSRERLAPSAVVPATWPNNFLKLLLVFTLVLRNPLLFEKLDRFYTSCFQGHRAAFTQPLPDPIDFEEAKALASYQRLWALCRHHSPSCPYRPRWLWLTFIHPGAVPNLHQTALSATIAFPRGWWGELKMECD
jgi:hypothetical protein